jgi:hypothetical protein
LSRFGTSPGDRLRVMGDMTIRFFNT